MLWIFSGVVGNNRFVNIISGIGNDPGNRDGREFIARNKITIRNNYYTIPKSLIGKG